MLVVTAVGDGRSATARSSRWPSSADKATSLGLRPGAGPRRDAGAAGALSVVASFRAVGTLLVFGLLVAPPATAVLIVRRLPRGDGRGGRRSGALAVVLGLAVSYHAETAASATVAGVAVAQFFVVLAVDRGPGPTPQSPSRSSSHFVIGQAPFVVLDSTVQVRSSLGRWSERIEAPAS